MREMQVSIKEKQNQIIHKNVDSIYHKSRIQNTICWRNSNFPYNFITKFEFWVLDIVINVTMHSSSFLSMYIFIEVKNC